MEYVNSLTSFRVDGRRPNEMRQLKGEVGVIVRADRSALFEMGNTMVIAAVYGPREVQNKVLDLNYIEDNAGGPDVTVGILAKMDKVTLLQMDAKLAMDTFENVMGLAIEGCKAIANYIREMLFEKIGEQPSPEMLRRGIPTQAQQGTGSSHVGSQPDNGAVDGNADVNDRDNNSGDIDGDTNHATIP